MCTYLKYIPLAKHDKGENSFVVVSVNTLFFIYLLLWGCSMTEDTIRQALKLLLNQSLWETQVLFIKHCFILAVRSLPFSAHYTAVYDKRKGIVGYRHCLYIYTATWWCPFPLRSLDKINLINKTGKNLIPAIQSQKVKLCWWNC